MTVLLVKSVVIIAVVLLGLSAASPVQAYSCEQVRTWHRQYGTAQLLRYARLYGVTAAQKRAAIRCIWRPGVGRRSR